MDGKRSKEQQKSPKHSSGPGKISQDKLPANTSVSGPKFEVEIILRQADMLQNLQIPETSVQSVLNDRAIRALPPEIQTLKLTRPSKKRGKKLHTR
ncbi:hypothetical protein BOTNAR_0782g00010 [Botryotinia narcissicola]|uniref:Uncharacterized protein n=1 Tax=Botryotinia narcissicola TaxID=278944 RepID=A0A4Z1HHV7_9HELO|nr:hypothetical protein BOTNAR_0782g00010 [Botryotinia narcissicola]